jgi:hypothetical protein
MANVLKMATVADIVTLMKAGHSDRRISAVLSHHACELSAEFHGKALCHSLADGRPGNYSTPSIGGFFPRTLRPSPNLKGPFWGSGK